MASTSKYIQIVLQAKDEMSSTMNKAADGLNKMSSSLTSIGTQMTAAITLPLIALGTAAVKTSAEFEQSLANIQSITKQTDESLSALGNSFLEMSMDMSKTTDSAQNLSEAYYLIIGSGVDAADAMDVLEAATKAASAGLTTTEVAAEAMVATLNAYGLEATEAARISDLMFQTVNRGVGSFEDLSSAMGSVVGSAAQLKVSEEELFAAIATLSKQGQSFETATTNINAALTSLMAPTDALQKAFSDLGYESGSAMIETLGFAGTMQKLAEYTGGSQEAMQALFGDTRSMRAAFGLTGKAADMFAEDIAAMGEATGAASEAFAINTNTFQAAMKNLQNVWQAFLIDLGNVIMPMLAPFVELLSNMLKAFMALPEPVKQVIVVIGGLLAVAGPLLLIFGQIAGAITAIQTLMVAFPAIAGVFSVAFLPVIALIGAVIAAIVLLIANWNQLGTTISQLATIIDQKLGGMFSSIRDELVKLISAIASAWGEILSKAGTALNQLGQLLWKWIGDIGKAAWAIGDAITGGLLTSLSNGFKQLVKWLLSQIINLISQVRNAFGIASPSKVMTELGENVVAGFHKGLENMGGIGVNVPSTGGSIQSRQPSLAIAGASGGGGSGSVFNIYTSAGTTDQQAKEIARKVDKILGQQGERRGAKKIR
jgi:TP901 family phage tail tape measure protein